MRRIAHQVALNYPNQMNDKNIGGILPLERPSCYLNQKQNQSSKVPTIPSTPKGSKAARPRLFAARTMDTTENTAISRLLGETDATENGQPQENQQRKENDDLLKEDDIHDVTDDWTESVASVQKGVQFDSYNLFSLYQHLGEKNNANSAVAAYIARCRSLLIAPLPVMDYLTERDADGHWEEHEECDLYLPHYGLGDRHAIAFGSFLSLCGLNLIDIDLRGNGIGIGGLTSLLNALKLHPQVRCLDLSHNKFANILQTGSDNQAVSNAEKALIALFPAEQQGGLHKIRRLELSDCNLQSGSLEILFSRFAAGAVPKLRHLDISRNCMRDSEGVALPAFISNSSHPLEWLNISWNTIRKEHAYNISVALKDNCRLVHLNIAQNHFGEERRCIVELASAIATNSTLEHIDLSYNEIEETGGMIFGFEALKHNKHLKTINLDGNPLGPGGGLALMAFNADGHKKISFHFCSLDLDNGGKSSFDTFKPDKDYDLDLGVDIDRLIARALLELAFDHQAHAGASCLANVTLDWKKYTPPIKRLVTDSFKEANPEVEEPTEDIPPPHRDKEGKLIGGPRLRFTFISHKLKEPERSTPEVYCKLYSLVKEHAAADERRSAQVILNATDLYAFSAKQGRALIEHLQIRRLRVEAVAKVVVKMNDPHNMELVMDALNELEQEQVKHMLGPLYYYNDNNPTGHYKLELHREQDRMVALRLTARNRQERMEVRRHRRPDLSQHGNGEYVRRSFYNGELFVYTSTWVVPRTGVWEFDYVSPIRPNEHARIMPHDKFSCFLSETVEFEHDNAPLPPKYTRMVGNGIPRSKVITKMNEELWEIFRMFDADESGEIDISELRMVFQSLGHTISDDDLQAMLAEADKDGGGEIDFEEFTDMWKNFLHQVHLKERLVEMRHVAATLYISATQLAEIIRHMSSSAERQGAFIIFYGRVVDEENFHLPLSLLKAHEVSYLAYHLGPISLFNPFRPNGVYELDLSHHDERLVCRMIIECNYGEPKPIILMNGQPGATFNGNGIGLTSWLKNEAEIPTNGRVCLEVSDNAKYNKRERLRIAKDFLGWEFEEGEEEELLQL